MPSFNPADIERRWQQFWEANKTFRTPDPDESSVAGKPKYYILDMFPYPSGAGLHVGHPEGYTATDILARYKRMRGFHVLHPMGWDAFGLPAEQYAIKTGQHPRKTTVENIATFRRQIKSLGFSYDWDREVDTTDPAYFKWTQWIFLTIYDTWYDPVAGKGRPISELPIPEEIAAKGDIDVGRYQDDHRLAYIGEQPVNWCPHLGTVLANEEVIDGKSERGGHAVIRLPLRQWLMRITAYAERLIDDLEPLDWSDAIKQMQRNWIGKSEGAEVQFQVCREPTASAEESGETITVFTTRPDTLFGATYMVLSPEHELVDTITTAEQSEAVKAYQDAASRKSDFDRMNDKKKTGVFTGAYAINPVNGEQIPIWIADYVLATYGTGAIMAVPAHDERDFEFAKQYGLDIQPVVKTPYAPFMSNDKAAQVWADRANAMEGIVVSHNLLNTRFTLFDYVPDQNRERLDTYVQKNPSAYLVVHTAGHTAVAHSDDQFDKSHLNMDLELPRSVPALLLTARTGTGVAVNSDFLDGLNTEEAKRKITAWLLVEGKGEAKVNYKLRDWLFSRQRYWGEPFPVLHAPDGSVIPLTVDDLPVQLPEMTDYKPTGSPDGPLAKAIDWLTVERDGDTFRRETNTMPQWAGSCWYYLRYIDPRNPQAFADAGKLNHWLPVDLYVGGAEHAVLHLLYSRFWHKVLFDRGYVNCPEPFHKLVNQGMILGEYEYCVPLDRLEDNHTAFEELGIKWTQRSDADSDAEAYYVLTMTDDLTEKRKGRLYIKGTTIEVTAKAEKMSKSRGNVISPDDVVKQYGADSLRLFEMFMGPLEAVKPWNMKGVEGVYRFLGRVWRLMIEDDAETVKLNATVQDVAPGKETLRELHRCIQKVTEDTEGMRFNTAISAMMELTNHLTKQEVRPLSVLKPFVLLLAPYAPHAAEELWAALGHGPTLAYEPWPAFDAELVKADEIEIPVQINGKLKAKLLVPAGIDTAGLEAAALADEAVKQALAGATPKKVIVVPKKLVNLVV